MTTNWTTKTKGTGRYADVNDINLYFEIHGAGQPMVLLHGGLGSGEMFGPILPQLAATHQVIAVDLQGHGRTADIDRPIDVRLMADDIAALISHLGLEKADVVGYSLGGGVALQIAAKHPAKVRRHNLKVPYRRVLHERHAVAVVDDPAVGLEDDAVNRVRAREPGQGRRVEHLQLRELEGEDADHQDDDCGRGHHPSRPSRPRRDAAELHPCLLYTSPSPRD